eukprot:CAMPEP_0181321356 /NCGR_PEP_ID=MMETSP1101-20121128/18636_1 /TAXON_ID=46948 /ORGANISM="Rhodomonas abbreviata, Strain Caron Lab Isolate" /LENGTH=307 /DNA_ID=CAMNT_0023429167 /DNA_START=576 /DNA_END=1499 /DNA_ORIENTATION=-
MECLRSAGVADEDGNWCGGQTVVVQVGDILDRGTDEAGCIEVLCKLRTQSRDVGGNVIMLLGNHEILNADLDFRYAKSGQFSEWKEDHGIASKFVEVFRGKRASIFKRGQGSMAMIMSSMPVVVQIGDTVFCHGGLTWAAIDHGFQALNRDTSAWLQGRLKEKPGILEPVVADQMEASPLWERTFGTDTIGSRALRRVDGMLRELGASNMVVGHTAQLQGVNGVETRAGRQVWRVDVGLSERRGRIECLEVVQSEAGSTVRKAVIGQHGRVLDAGGRLQRHPGRGGGEEGLSSGPVLSTAPRQPCSA